MARNIFVILSVIIVIFQEPVRAHYADYNNENQNQEISKLNTQFDELKKEMDTLQQQFNALGDQINSCGFDKQKSGNKQKDEILELILGMKGIKVNLSESEDMNALTLTPFLQWNGAAVYPHEITSICKNIPNLKSLKLKSIRILSLFTPEDRVILNNLKEFVLDIDNRALPQEMQHAHSSGHLKSFLFFDKDSHSNWSVGNITQLQMDIQLSYNGHIVLKLNRKEKEIKLSRIQSADDILSNLHPYNFKLEKLVVDDCLLNVSSIPTGLKQLSFAAVQVFGISVHENWLAPTLRKQAWLSHLCYSFFTHGTAPQLQTVSLADFANMAYLKHLALTSVSIMFTPAMRFNLETLYLFSCKLDNDILENFSNVFQARKVYIYIPDEHQQPYKLLKALLRMDFVDTIWMGMHSVMPYQNIVGETLTHLLKQYIIELKTEDLAYFQEVGFILEKTISGGWKGRQLNNIEIHHEKYNLCRQNLPGEHGNHHLHGLTSMMPNQPPGGQNAF